MRTTSPALRASGPLRSMLAVAALTVLAACTHHLADLERANPQAGTFETSLASEYLDYARSESEQGRHSAAEYFAGKGLKALRGESVPPESVEKAKISESDKPILQRSRQQLMSLLGDSSRSILPQKAARAQLLFDCWIAKKIANAPKEEIESCSTEFTDTMQDLRQSPGALQTPIPHFEVLFAIGSAEPDSAAKKVIRHASKLAKNLKTCQIHLTGHTDRVGKATQNQRLSERRVQAVKSLLERDKLCTKEIIVDAMGETSPKVRAPNGVAEPQNRRVDIEITRGEP